MPAQARGRGRLGVADSGDPEQDLSELLVEIGEVAQATRSGALFLIDEMHNLRKAVEELRARRRPGAFKSIVHAVCNISID